MTLFETYITAFEIHLVLQCAFLGYLLGLPSKAPVKRKLTWLVFTYVLYAFFSVPMGRGSFPAGAEAFTTMTDFPDVYGVDYQLWVGLVFSSVIVFLVACLDFWYGLLNRKRDWVFYFFVLTSCIGVIHWTTSADEVFVDFRDSGEQLATFYFPGYFYGLFLLGRELRRLPDGLERRRLRIIFYAFLIPIVVIFINQTCNRLGLISEEAVQMINQAVGLLRTALLIVAIKVYGLFRLNLTEASQDIFDTMDDPVLLLSADDEVTRANPAAQSCLGVPERPGRGSAPLHVGQILPQYTNQLQRFEASIVRDGEPREYLCTRSTIIRQEFAVGNVVLLRDITRERELARMKTEFTSTVSHELRTPLTSVLGFAKIIQKRFQEVILANYEPKEKKELRAVKQIGQNLEVIVSESKRLTKLINDVLDISKMEAGKIEWTFDRSPPLPLIEQAIQATDGLFGTKPVSLVRNFPENVPDVVVDADRIIQVIINLISNAVKFTDEGDVTLTLVIEGGHLRISVTDTGIGISEADQAKVFEKYKQVGDVMTDRPQGTGLGLPISKEIVEHHGGKLWVESVIGEGSTFIFTLPLADVSTTDQEPLSFTEVIRQVERLQWTPSSGGQRILVVDDEAPIREVLRQSLEAAGHTVIEAEDGVKGLAAARESRPDVIILDVMMPFLSGFDVAASLKNDPDLLAIPILMLTVVDDAQRAYGLGVERYLNKPFEPQKIVAEINALIEAHKEPANALILGEPAQHDAALKDAIEQAKLKAKEAKNMSEFKLLAEKFPPRIVIVFGEEYQDASYRTEIQSALGSRATLTRFVAVED